MSWLDDLKLKKEFTPQDLALMRMGATMMSNNRQGFGHSLGSGISAGLDEYSRGVQQAEDARHKKAIEGYKQRGLDISAAGVASENAFKQSSLELERKKQAQTKLRDQYNRKKIMAETGLAGAQTAKTMQEVERLRRILGDADAKAKLDKKLKEMEEAKPGFMARLFAPREVQQTPLDQRNPADLSTQEMFTLANQKQQQKMEQQQQLDQVMKDFKNKEEEKPIRELLQFMIEPGLTSGQGPPALPGMMQRYK